LNLHWALLPLRKSGRSVLVGALAVTAAVPSHAQGSPPERTYSSSQGEVEKALRDLGAYSGARLPALEGFVASFPATAGRFERPYYQFQIELVRLAPERTLVRLTAKITAWYADSEPSRSGYHTLPSNGRLEMDLFDRIDDYLKKKGFDLPTKPELSSTAKPTTLNDAIALSPPAARPPKSSPANAPTTVASLNEEIARVRSQREAAERRLAQLSAEVKELEETLRSQVSPSNLASIKASRAAFHDRPTDMAHIVLWAEAEDEFEILEDRGDWVKVSFGTDAQGWVRSSQLRLAADKGNAAAARSPEDELGFVVTREEVSLFSGEWPELKGKQALFIWTRPSAEIPKGILGQRQLAYAKRIFADRYLQASHSQQPFAGVVVVFLGPRGGVAANTLAHIRRWRDGLLPDAEFLKRCSLDPPEAFRDLPKQ